MSNFQIIEACGEIYLIHILTFYQITKILSKRHPLTIQKLYLPTLVMIQQFLRENITMTIQYSFLFLHKSFI